MPTRTKKIITGILFFLFTIAPGTIAYATNGVENPDSTPAATETENDTVSIGELFPGQENFIPNQDPENPEESLPAKLFFKVITILLQVIGAVTLIIFIMGGLLLIVSEGDENRISAGRNMVKYGIIGLIIAFASYFIAIGIQSLLLSE